MENAESRWGWLITIGQYFAWLITAIGAVLDALYLRDAFSALLNVLQVIHSTNYTRGGGIGIDFTFAYAMTAYDEVMILILGLAAVAAVIAIEYYFRKGRPKGLLFKRIGLVVGIEIAIVAVSIIFQQII